MELADRLAQLVASHAPQAAAWFQEALKVPGRFETAFAAAGRKLGQTPAPVPDVPVLDNRGLDEIGRVALLLATPARASEMFYRGDTREKQAVLRALPLLKDPLVDIGVEAVRSSVQGVFEAIACENPFPADRFSESQLNQLVLKALFTETPVARIAGLEKRVTPELMRMVQGYASERRAAGRTVPEDIQVILHLGGER